MIIAITAPSAHQCSDKPAWASYSRSKIMSFKGSIYGRIHAKRSACCYRYLESKRGTLFGGWSSSGRPDSRGILL